MFDSIALTRRACLRGGAFSAVAMLGATAAFAQRSTASSEPPTVLQVVDTSPTQQDVAKDFLTGSLAAWQELNAGGGVRGRPVVHRKFEINTQTTNWQVALSAALENPSVVAISGTVSEGAAGALRQHLSAAKLQIPHVAPWLHDIERADQQTFPIFANRQMQMMHALKSLSMAGMKDVGAVYAAARDRDLYQEGVARAAAGLKLRLVSFTGGGDARELGRRVSAQVPAVTLFLGGTPELARFTQGLADQARQRYVVALADVNLQILRQMGSSPRIPVIAAQVVPLSRSSMPVVMSYRAALARLFDEPASSLSLAGYLAARYTQQVLAGIQGPLDRASTWAAFKQRQTIDLGGFRVAYDDRGLGGAYVTQSMLTADGREVG